MCLLTTSGCVFFQGAFLWAVWDDFFRDTNQWNFPLKTKKTHQLRSFPPQVFHNSPPNGHGLTARGTLSLAHKSLAKSWVNVWAYTGSLGATLFFPRLIPKRWRSPTTFERVMFSSQKRSPAEFLGGEFVVLRVSWWMCQFCWSDSCSERFGGLGGLARIIHTFWNFMD